MSYVKLVKYLVGFTLCASLFIALCDKLCPFLLSPYNLTSLFALSSWGIHNSFFWQFFSYTFFYPTSEGLTPSYLLHLFFNLFVIWRLGTSLVHLKGVKHFLGVYFGGSLIAGLVAYLTLWIGGSPLLFAGPSAAIFSLLMTAVIVHPEMELILFLTFPIRARWIILGITLSILLIDLSSGAFLPFFSHLAALVYGYLYSITVLKCKSPFKTLHKIEAFLFKCESIFLKRKKGFSLDHYAKTDSKVYDFQTGERILSHEELLKASEAKIASEGVKSLSLREKFVLWHSSRKEKKAKAAKANYDKWRDS